MPPRSDPGAKAAGVLPALLTSHDDSTLGFASPDILSGGVPVARATSDDESTAVQWSLDGGRRVVTLLGYWRPGENNRRGRIGGYVKS